MVNISQAGEVGRDALPQAIDFEETGRIIESIQLLRPHCLEGIDQILAEVIVRVTASDLLDGRKGVVGEVEDGKHSIPGGLGDILEFKFIVTFRVDGQAALEKSHCIELLFVEGVLLVSDHDTKSLIVVHE